MPQITHIEILELPQQPVLSIHTESNIDMLPQIIGKKIDEIFEYMRTIGKYMSGMPFVAIEKSNYPDKNLFPVIIGIPVSSSLSGEGNIKAEYIPAGKMISCMHRGAYHEMSSLYNEMWEWISKNGYEAEGKVYEFYYNGLAFPSKDYLTRIMIPVKSRLPSFKFI